MKHILFLILIIFQLNGVCQEQELFYLTPINYDTLQQGAFINISDKKSQFETPFHKLKVEEIPINQSTYTLKGENRTKTLKGIKISENDQIFIYSMLLDTVFIIPIKNASLVVKPNPYMGLELGLKILNLPLENMGNFYWNSFVQIGKSNPFTTGNIHQIIWTEVDSSSFPKNIKSTNHENWFDSYPRGKVFQFKTSTYTYLIQNLKSKEPIPQGRHLIVYRENIDSLVFNYIYMDTESTSLSDLNSPIESNQWTGNIFKNKPPIIYGFLWMSFGCPRIDLIGENQTPISIQCDNRH